MPQKKTSLIRDRKNPSIDIYKQKRNFVEYGGSGGSEYQVQRNPYHLVRQKKTCPHVSQLKSSKFCEISCFSSFSLSSKMKDDHCAVQVNPDNTEECIKLDTLPDSSSQDTELKIPLDNNVLSVPGKDLKQDVHLIDINTKKTWKGYITKTYTTMGMYSSVETADQWTLTYSQLHTQERYSFDISNHFKFDTTSSCIFLSISPNGNRIALSSMRVDDESGFASENNIHNPDCLIFIRSKQLKIHKIKFQGRAMFSKDGKLMLIKKDILEVYDKSYQKTHWYNLRSFGATPKIPYREQLHTLTYMLHLPYTSYSLVKDQSPEKTEIKHVIAMSKHIRHNVLITSQKNRAQVWSITENGVRLTAILKKENEQIMAFSQNYKFLATFDNDERCVNIYNIKSGLRVYKLKPKNKVDQDTTFKVTYIRFCKYAYYVVMTGIETNKDESSKVTFEAWHVQSEQTIYFKEEEIYKHRVNDFNKTFQPFVLLNGDFYTTQQKDVSNNPQETSDIMESTFADNRRSEHDEQQQPKVPKKKIFTALYVDYADKDTTIEKRLDIDIYEEIKVRTCSPEHVLSADTHSSAEDGYSNWERIDTSLLHLDDMAEIQDSPASFDKLACYTYKTDKDVYVLRFGRHMVQLWRLHYETVNRSNGDIQDQDELLYIHAYKSPDYGFKFSFEDVWALEYKESSDIRFMKNVNREQLERIVVTISMGRSDNIISTDSEIERTTWRIDEELFIPFNDLIAKKTLRLNNIHLLLKSACQALHYLDTHKDTYKKYKV